MQVPVPVVKVVQTSGEREGAFGILPDAETFELIKKLETTPPNIGPQRLYGGQYDATYKHFAWGNGSKLLDKCFAKYFKGIIRVCKQSIDLKFLKDDYKYELICFIDDRDRFNPIKYEILLKCRIPLGCKDVENLFNETHEFYKTGHTFHEDLSGMTRTCAGCHLSIYEEKVREVLSNPPKFRWREQYFTDSEGTRTINISSERIREIMQERKQE